MWRGVERAVDEHDAVFAEEAVGGGGVDVLDQPEFVAGEVGGGGEVGRGVDAVEVLAGVVAGAAEEEGEFPGVEGW